MLRARDAEPASTRSEISVVGSVRLAKLANVMGYVDDGVLGRWQGRNWLHSLSIGMYGPEGFEPLSPED